MVVTSSDYTSSPLRAVHPEECDDRSATYGATSVAGSTDNATSSIKGGVAQHRDGEDDSLQQLRAAISSRLPGTTKRRDERDGVRILTGLTALDGGVLSIGDLLSVVGPSRVGKTQVLYALIAGAIAPVPAGRASCVCYFEHLERVDVTRVRRLLRDRLLKSGAFLPELVASEVDTAVKERLFVYRVTTTLQLSVTLYSLLDHLHTRVGSDIDMVLIDGLGAMHHRDVDIQASNGTDWEAVLMHVMRRLARSKLVALVVSECAILEPVSVGAKLLGITPHEMTADQIPTRPMPFMPREYTEDLVTHTLILYYGEDRSHRGALVLRSPRRYGAHKLITSGELIVSADLVTIQQQAEAMTCSQRQ